jgi:hypothetical protein
MEWYWLCATCLVVSLLLCRCIDRLRAFLMFDAISSAGHFGRLTFKGTLCMQVQVSARELRHSWWLGMALTQPGTENYGERFLDPVHCGARERFDDMR